MDIDLMNVSDRVHSLDVSCVPAQIGKDTRGTDVGG